MVILPKSVIMRSVGRNRWSCLSSSRQQIGSESLDYVHGRISLTKAYTATLTSLTCANLKNDFLYFLGVRNKFENILR